MPTPRKEDKAKDAADPRDPNITRTRIVFIPWEFPDAQEWIDKTTQWNWITGNKFKIVFYRPGIILRELSDASDDHNATIYIRGHGAAGVANIQVKVGEPPNQIEKKLSIEEACDRLISSGLKKRFSGAIKFFHCYSGTVMTEQGYTDHVGILRDRNAEFRQAYKEHIIEKDQYNKFKKQVLKNKSIAKVGADYMRKKGYKQCIYFGYLGPLESEYADDGLNNWHKQTNLDELQNSPLTGTVRASLGRIQV